ncbi:adenosine deaminase [Photobacterium frigidiphilum]|uniref:Adenine deaminase n=1 Tax=Photobacterium frigidiphilum TaxID=264736 RepID=A0A2T3J781_9GAMM|nr:adenosine deaminase [Photobacterium frigidiphilum]PSU44590.1 adenosine deaminase [Photobacterium frigidiphilum]
MDGFIKTLPKVELHLHIEGTLEPELMFALAKRNSIDLPYESVAQVQAAYDFDDLQSFLDLYYQGAQVLLHEQDFYDLTWAYLKRCKTDHVIHTEIFFDPQMHTARGVPFDAVINGITRALEDGQEQLNISSHTIMCFLRHLSEEDAIETLQQALPYKDKIIGVGLDSSEQGHPPEKFKRVFEQAKELGFLTVAHAGEEGPASNIWDGLDMLHISRVDHGVRCIEDESLVQHLVEKQIPLTVCPLSNVKLKVFDHMRDHNIVELLRKGLCVTVNSDDPAYFGGYMVDNFLAVAHALNPSKRELAKFTENAIEASFLTLEEKTALKEVLQHYIDKQLKPIL